MKEATGLQSRKSGYGYDVYRASSYAEEMRRRMDYYNGVQFMQDATSVSEEYITPQRWNQLWSGYGWEDIRAMLADAIKEIVIHPTSYPFARMAVDSQNVVYAVPVEQRLLKVDTEPDDDSSKLLNLIYTEAEHDLQADQLCKWTGLFNTAFQITAYDPKKRRIVRRNLPPYTVYVVPAAEDPTDLQHPDCFVAIAQLDQGITQSAPQLVVWQCWWQNQYWYETHQGQEFKDAGLTVAGTNVNPYKDMDGNTVKPITVTHSRKSDEIYLASSDQLVLMNQRLDRDLTALSSVMEFQGFAVPVASGVNPEEMQGQPWSHGAMIVLPDGNARLEFIHPVVQVNEFFTAIVKKARLFAIMIGVDPAMVDPDSKVQSGVSKAQQRMALIEKREELFPQWVPYEREVYYLTAIIWNTHNKKNQLIEIPRYGSALDEHQYTIQMIFGELQPIVDPLADTLEKINRVKGNFATRADVIGQERRVPKEDAVRMADAIYETNMAELMKTATMLGTAAPTSQSGGLAAPSNDKVRIGQSGNRPLDSTNQDSDTGNNTTASSGNNTVGAAVDGSQRVQTGK